MPINFIPNDPLATFLAGVRTQSARPDRPASRAAIRVSSSFPEAPHAVGTPAFTHWQAREAALAAVEVWEGIAGNVTRWARAQPDRSVLLLIPDAGDKVNAFYDGDHLEFFHATDGGKTTFSGNSTDVVSHETGHACLDALRPDLWASSVTEVAAFHEAMGDSVALLTALSDAETRKRLLAGPGKLDNGNFVETLMEDLADGARRRLGKDHPAAAARQALNTFRWQLPTTLPMSGKPTVLTSEVHSFSRVFTGCFYDLVRGLFSAGAQNEAALLNAARTAGRLLLGGVRKAPNSERFYQAVGRAMILSDAAENQGANRDVIRKAFDNHGIALGSAAMLAPSVALKGKFPQKAGSDRAGALPQSTRSDLKRRLGAEAGTRMKFSAVTIGDRKVVEAVHMRPVRLDDVSAELAGVVAMGPESVLVGGESGRAAVLGALPHAGTTEDEVQHFVATLLAAGAIETSPPRRRKSSALGAVASDDAGSADRSAAVTHVIRQRGGRKVLERVRFACRHTG